MSMFLVGNLSTIIVLAFGITIGWIGRGKLDKMKASKQQTKP